MRHRARNRPAAAAAENGGGSCRSTVRRYNAASGYCYRPP